MFQIMGVLNATPDSFYAHSRLAMEATEARIRQMLESGADWIDIGGESTRPGAQSVSAEEEWQRVEGALRQAVKLHAAVSIDTSKAWVAERAIAAGARLVNDVTALGDPRMAEVCARAEVRVVLMHMQGTPRTMQDAPHYDDLVGEIGLFFENRISRAIAAGIPRERLILDPGIGFGKSYCHNLAILRHLSAFKRFELPLLVGASRKAFIGHLLGGLPAEERLEGSLAAHVMAVQNGASIIRTHDVEAHRRALTVAAAIQEAP